MVTLEQMITRSKSLASDRSFGLDLVRIYLGIGLVVRGALFVANPAALLEMMQARGEWLWPIALGHFIAMAHLAGGSLLAVGLATRIAAAFQVPVLLGALLFVHGPEGLLGVGQSLELVGLVLVLLIAFSVFGAGKFSLDHYLSQLSPNDERQRGFMGHLTR